MQETSPLHSSNVNRGGLSWARSPFAELLRLAWPIAVATISFSIVTLVDTLIVGRLGTAELAGVGLAGTASFFVLCFSFGLLQGAKVLVSQAIGAGRRDEVLRYVAVATATALVLGVMTAGLTFGIAPLVARLAATHAASESTLTYMRIRALGAPFVLLQVALREILQAQGNTQAPMRATIVANAANIALALLLVFPLRMGVAGAAVAAAVSHAIEAGVVVLVQRSLGGFGLGNPGRNDAPRVRPDSLITSRTGWRAVLGRAFDRAHLSQLLRVGLPTGLQFMLEVGSFAMLTLAVSTFAEADMAAHQIALQLVHFSFMPCVAIGEAAAVLSGQAVGADRDDLVQYVSHRALLLATTYATLCSVVFFMAGRWLSSGFTADPLVIALAVRLLRLAAGFGLFDAINIIARCVLRGAGDVRFAAIVSVSVTWLCTPTLAWGLGHGLRMGAFGGWLGILLEVLALAAVLGVRVERRGWAEAARAARARLRREESETEVASEPMSRRDRDGADLGQQAVVGP